VVWGRSSGSPPWRGLGGLKKDKRQKEKEKRINICVWNDCSKYTNFFRALGESLL